MKGLLSLRKVDMDLGIKDFQGQGAFNQRKRSKNDLHLQETKEKNQNSLLKKVLKVNLTKNKTFQRNHKDITGREDMKRDPNHQKKAIHSQGMKLQEAKNTTN